MTTQARFPYQDPTVDIDRRVDDLMSRMELEDKVGLMFQPIAAVGALDEASPYSRGGSVHDMLGNRINHMNILMAPTARKIAEWYNAVQAAAAERPLGIPVSVSSDPRHSFNNNPATSFLAGPFSEWPETLGFGAIGSDELVLHWADTIRQEYLATGIRVALHPQIDLATEPRWARQSATFGEDADLVSRLGVAYVRGLQGEQVGPTSVSAMAKHFPGGGPQKDGEDPHFPYGREQVYPGDNFDYHLKPFKAVLAAGVGQVMPYYGMPVGTDLEEVGFSFNKQVITGMLREELGFDGVVCTDWGILSTTCWGVEELSYEDRLLKALDAGVDQFGGEACTDLLAGLVRAGTVSEARIDTSVRRLLRQKFQLGLFENPQVDADAADELVGGPVARAEGLAAQCAAHTLLTNDAGRAHLPLPAGLKVYVENIKPESLAGRATVVDTPAEADVAILRLVTPWEQRGVPGEYESFFHAGSLAYPDEEIERIAAIAAAVPTVLDVYLERPAILTELSEFIPALIVNFGASDEAVVRVLFGDDAPQGRLPFDLPSSMEAVIANRPDVPFDTKDPAYRFGFGLSYS